MSLDPIAKKLVDIDESLKIVEETLLTKVVLKTDLDQINNKLDFLVSKFQDFNKNDAIQDYKLEELDLRVTDLEKERLN